MPAALMDKKDTFAGEWSRKKARVTQNADYRGKRVEELLCHLDRALFLYAQVLMQRCAAAIGCKLVKDVVALPRQDAELFRKSAQVWLDRIQDPRAVQRTFRKAPQNWTIEKLIAGNEASLVVGLAALKAERRWLQFVPEARIAAVTEALEAMIKRLDEEQQIDENNAAALDYYSSLPDAD